MSGLIVPQFPSGITTEELADLVAKLAKEVDWFANGNISDQNISIIAGYRASATELKHKSGIVGMSGYDAANPLAVRFWAGNADKSLAQYRVLQNGKMYATDGEFTGIITASTIIGSEIMTALEGIYPRSAMSTTGNLFIAEQSATEFIKMMSDYLGAVALLIYSSTVNGLIGPVGDVLLINTAHTKGGIQISSGGDLELYADVLDPTKVVKVNAWNRFVNEDTGDNLQYELSRLQSAIDSKQPLITSGDVTVIDGVAYLDDTGIAPGTWTKLTVGSDGRATAGNTLSSGDIPTLAQSKITNLTTDLAAKASKTQQAWQTPTLTNSWVNFDIVNGNGAGYYLDEVGVVHLRGIIKSGTLGAAAFTLPAGYRPFKILVMMAISDDGVNNLISRVDIDSGGNVKPTTGGTAFLSLEGISFRAEQ